MFTTSNPELQEYTTIALQLFEAHQENRPLVAFRKKKAREGIKILAHVPGGWSGAMIVYAKRMVASFKVATWVAATQCEDCNAFHIATSLEPVEERFVCEDCGEGWCNIMFVAGSTKRAHTAFDVSRAKHDADPTETMTDKELRVWEEKQRGSDMHRLEREAHARWVEENGCTVRRQGSECPWCKERR